MDGTVVTASQVFNKHLSNGDIVFSASVTPRAKENMADPQLAYGKESYAVLEIFQVCLIFSIYHIRRKL